MKSINNIKLKDILVVFCVFATPCIQLALTIARELSLSTFIGGYNIFFTEFFAVIFIFVNVFFLNKLNYDKITFFIFSGLFISFISCWINGYDNWFLRFLIGADFYLYGLLLSVVTFNQNQLRIIRFCLLVLFGFICTQMILISTGAVSLDKGTDIDGVIRFGSTAGSSIKTAFLIFIIMAILSLLYKKRAILIGIYTMGFLSIAFSLSRGPILSLLFVSILFAIVHLKKYRKKIIISIIIVCCALFVLEKQYHYLTVMQERNNTEDITSGRDERWIRTLDIYKNSSLFFGAGNAITPSERRVKSNPVVEDNLVNSPHNIYLSFLVENGILGLVNYILLLVVLIQILKKKKTPLSYSFLIFLSLPLIMMNTEVILRNGDVAFFFWFLFYLLKTESGKYKVLT